MGGGAASAVASARGALSNDASLAPSTNGPSMRAASLASGAEVLESPASAVEGAAPSPRVWLDARHCAEPMTTTQVREAGHPHVPQSPKWQLRSWPHTSPDGHRASAPHDAVVVVPVDVLVSVDVSVLGMPDVQVREL
jgi:hypothetical protein